VETATGTFVYIRGFLKPAEVLSRVGRNVLIDLVTTRRNVGADYEDDFATNAEWVNGEVWAGWGHLSHCAISQRGRRVVRPAVQWLGLSRQALNPPTSRAIIFLAKMGRDKRTALGRVSAPVNRNWTSMDGRLDGSSGLRPRGLPAPRTLYRTSARDLIPWHLGS